MEQFIELFKNINDVKTLFILCGIFIFTDVLTGYLKGMKLKKINSSISRDGYIKKLAWIISLLLGFAIDYLVKCNIFLIGSACICVATEGISVYENLGSVGVKLPFTEYFEKLKEGELNDNSK